MNRIFILRFRTWLFCVVIFLAGKASGQVVACFSMKDLGGNLVSAGCVPDMIIQFLDCSTVNGAPVPYRTVAVNGYDSHHWDFGWNNSTSNAQSPVFGYFASGTFFITLTVTPDGVNYSSVTDTIIVYESPVVNMLAVPTQGCNPLNVCFTDLSTSANGSIVETIFDFGDGNVTRTPNPCHTFNLLPQQNCFQVSMQVKNSFGCISAKSFPNAVCIDRPPVANFASNVRLLCDTPFAVSFLSTSTVQPGNGATYSWDFGDSTTGTGTNPTHIYQNQGSYNVTLTVTDTDCNQTKSITKNAWINARLIHSDFLITQTVFCEGGSTQFINRSAGTDSANFTYTWNFGFPGGPTTQKDPNVTYAAPGTYSVSLTVQDALGCSDIETKTNVITVNPKPNATFTSSGTSSCQAPFDVSFTALSCAGCTYAWNFGDGETSTVQNPTHTYDTTGNFSVTLEVTGQNGCTGVQTQSGYISIAPRNFDFLMDKKRGCAPLTVRFIDNTQTPLTDPVTGWDWKFQDPPAPPVGTSNLENPVFTFNDTGTYVITFTGITASGCDGTVTDTVFIGVPLTPNFAIDSTPTCVNEEVNFINLTNDSTLPPGSTVTYFWDLGVGTSVLRDPAPVVYDEPDTLFVRLSAGFNGCFDTIEKQIMILHPKADFSYLQTCATPDRIQFTDESENADTWKWYFGDGDSTFVRNPIHIYDSSGTYQVKLVVTNMQTGCEDEYEQTVRVSILHAEFDANKYQVCTGDIITFQDRSTGLNLTRTWNFGEGAPSSAQNPTFSYNTPGTKTVTLTITDQLNCTDTETKTAFIAVTGVNADFTASSTGGCIPPTGAGSTVTFSSTSVISGSTVFKYYWDFGDNTTDSISGANASHTYSAPGNYTVALRVKTAAGCEDTESKVSHVTMRRPDACFTVPGTIFCRDQSVPVTNCTQGGGTFTWNFGDGSQPVIAQSPTHVYTDTGTFTITMSMVDVQGCVDDAPSQTVRITFPDIGFQPDSTYSKCPPLLTCFRNLSTLDTIAISSVLWDFGDGNFSTLVEPCHLYTISGLFDVKLTVWFANLCVDSMTVDTVIFIGGATGNIVMVPDTGCVPLRVSFDANSTGAASHYWIWQDGEQGVLSSSDTASHTYFRPGEYIPGVVLTDTQNPPCSYILYSNTTLVIDTVYANFTTGADTVCREDPVQFTDVSSTLTGDSIKRWLWFFSDDNSFDTTQNPVHAFTGYGPQYVLLTAFSKIGCSSTVRMDIYVRDKPTAAFTVSSNVGCDNLLLCVNDNSTDGTMAPITQWRWDFDDPSTNSDIFGVRFPPCYQYNDTGSFNPTLVVTDLDGCDDTATAQINVYKSPQGILLPDTQICEHDTVQLVADSGYVAYQWSPTSGLSNATAYNPLAYPATTTTYRLSITEGHGCDKLDSIIITVIPLPPLSVTPHPSVAICAGDSVRLVATGGLSNHWEPGFGLDDQNISNPWASPTVTVDYVVTNVGLAGCQNRDTVRVIVNGLNAQFAGERSCLGDSTNYIDFSTTTELPVTNWFWNFGETGSPSNTSTLRNPAHTYAGAGSYTVQLVVMDSTGCTDTTTGLTIIDNLPNASAGPNSVICLGDSIQLFASGGTTFSWTPRQNIMNPDSANPVVFPAANTTYIANVTNGVCPYDTAEVEIIVMPLPVVQTIDDTYIIRGETIQLVTTADRYNTVLWTPADSLSCVNCLSPYARPYIKTTYRVTVMDEFGCTSYDEVTIDADVECKEDQVYIANAFTPNGDGINDELKLHLHGIEKVKYYRTYDRWGKLMFETDDMNMGWDGKNSNGEQLSSGVYVYVVEAVCFYGKTIVKTGNVTLIK